MVLHNLSHYNVFQFFSVLSLICLNVYCLNNLKNVFYKFNVIFRITHTRITLITYGHHIIYHIFF